MKPVINAEIEAEFLRIPDAVRLSGLSKSTLYLLIGGGRLASKCVRAPGSVKGVRLISKQVLRDFINSCEDAPADEKGGTK